MLHTCTVLDKCCEMIGGVEIGEVGTEGDFFHFTFWGVVGPTQEYGADVPVLVDFILVLSAYVSKWVQSHVVGQDFRC